VVQSQIPDLYCTAVVLGKGVRGRSSELLLIVVRRGVATKRAPLFQPAGGQPRGEKRLMKTNSAKDEEEKRGVFGQSGKERGEKGVPNGYQQSSRRSRHFPRGA